MNTPKVFYGAINVKFSDEQIAFGMEVERLSMIRLGWNPIAWIRFIVGVRRAGALIRRMQK